MRFLQSPASAGPLLRSLHGLPLLLDTARLESTEKVVGRSGTILPNMEGNWLLHRARHRTVQTAAPALQKYDLILSYSVGQVGAVVAPAQLAGVVDADRQTRHWGNGCWGKGKVDCDNLHKGLLLVRRKARPYGYMFGSSLYVHIHARYITVGHLY